MEDIKRVLTEFIIDKFQIDKDDKDFTQSVHLFDYGYIDSFGAVELINFIESTYGIAVTNKDLMMYNLNTINEIAELVKRKVEDKK